MLLRPAGYMKSLPPSDLHCTIPATFVILWACLFHFHFLWFGFLPAPEVNATVSVSSMDIDDGMTTVCLTQASSTSWCQQWRYALHKR